MKSRPRATDFQVNNVRQWLTNANGTILPEEVEFVDQLDDLIPVVPRQKAPLRRFIDRHNLLRLPFCLRERKVRQLSVSCTAKLTCRNPRKMVVYMEKMILRQR